MNLLSDTQTMSFGMNSTLFTGMLGELMFQNGFASAQLGEQQLYDAAALEGASAMYLLVTTLSGDVTRMAEYLLGILDFSKATSENVGQMLPLLADGGGSGNAINDSANTAFGAVGALADLNQAKTAFAGVGGLFKGATGILGMVGSLAPLLSTALPFLIGGAAIAGIGGLIFSAVKSSKTAKENSKASEPILKDASSKIDPPPAVISDMDAFKQKEAAKAVDPFSTERGKDSAYNKYQGEIEGSRQTADTLREAVRVGNDEVVTRLDAVADALQRLAEKPADRHIKSEVVIQSLSTSMTFSEFRDKLNEVLERETQTAP